MGWDLLAVAVSAGILPVLLDKTSEAGYFNFLKKYLREAWSLILAFWTLYYLRKPEITEVAVNLHRNLGVHDTRGYILVGLIGASVFCLYWWFTGAIVGVQVETTRQVKEVIFQQFQEELTRRFALYNEGIFKVITIESHIADQDKLKLHSQRNPIL